MEQSFGSYRFDAGTGRLWAGSREIRLTPKASAVLQMLVTHAGEPVTKEALFATVWRDAAVGDDALTSCIQELRRALEDDPRQPRFIETRHRRGYRFVAELGSPGRERAEARAETSDISSIAVLPFADMSPGRDQDYLCEGLAEELINALTHIDGLRVASRTASFQFRASGADIRAVGRHLGVGTLLEGSVRKAEDRLRVTVQLIEVATGYHRWSQRFDRKLDDVFAIQDEIAESVATSLRGSMLSGREKQGLARPQTGAEAYEYYLRGRQTLPRMTHSDLETSRDMFERAIGLDAGYSPAWAGLATVHATLYEWFGARDEDLASAERASQRALELAPGLAEAYVARGSTLSLSGRYEEAALEFEAAIRLNPNLFDAYYYYARSSFASGDIARSAELFGRAGEVRHEDFQSVMLQAQSLRMIGRSEEWRVATREGIRRAEQMLALNPLDGRALGLGSGALFDDGQRARAIEWSQRALELYPDDLSTLLTAACLSARTGQKEQALGLLERVFARGWGKRDWVEHDPDYDTLRDDPRFQRLLARLK
jgi:TolB-like protein